MKKIMFSDKYGLTRAVLDGNKTMTRRIIPGKIIEAAYRDVSWATVHLEPTDEHIDSLTDKAVLAHSYYKVGDIVAVAQRYKDAIDPLDWVNTLIYKDERGWTNKMYVCSEMMPHQIVITGIRIEHLHDISAEDCIKEGITRKWLVPGRWFYYLPNVPVKSKNDVYLSHDEAFATLIDKLSRKKVWEKNPLVFVYSFELVK